MNPAIWTGAIVVLATDDQASNAGPGSLTLLLVSFTFIAVTLGAAVFLMEWQFKKELGQSDED